MSNIAMQLERTADGNVAVASNVIFDNILYSSGDIIYNAVTGVITFNVTGRYVINWWVATQSSSSTTGASFSLSSSQGDLQSGISPIKTGEVSGFGIIDVISAPVTLSLVNSSASTVFYPSNLSTKASLIIVQDDIIEEPSGLLSYGGLYSEISQPIIFPLGGGELEIAFEEIMPSLNVTYSGNTITVQNAGVYEVSYLLVVSTAPSGNLTSNVRINGFVSSVTNLGLIITNVSFTTFAVSAFVNLAAGDILNLYVESANEISTILGPQLSAYLTVKQIS